MTPPRRREYDFTWRRRNLAAIWVMCAAAGIALAVAAGGSRIWFTVCPPIDESRVAAATELIDPNTASAASLCRLPKIGPVKAQAVVDYRASHGPRPFRSYKDLAKVRGIGPTLADLAEPYLNLPSR